ncbi:MAG: hypothetical protein ACI9LV_000691 [Candidatus Nanohaloarchaea archaeon]|jgi:hypothetical protein
MGEDGVTIEFLSKEKLNSVEFEEKLELVLEKVKDNAVLVLEESWAPGEKRELIKTSMEEVDDDFPGVEFMGLNSENTRLEKARNFVYDKFLNEDYRRGITIVGNSRVMEKIKEEKDTVSFLAKMEEESS